MLAWLIFSFVLIEGSTSNLIWFHDVMQVLENKFFNIWHLLKNITKLKYFFKIIFRNYSTFKTEIYMHLLYVQRIVSGKMSKKKSIKRKYFYVKWSVHCHVFIPSPWRSWQVQSDTLVRVRTAASSLEASGNTFLTRMGIVWKIFK